MNVDLNDQCEVYCSGSQPVNPLIEFPNLNPPPNKLYYFSKSNSSGEQKHQSSYFLDNFRLIAPHSCKSPVKIKA